ncbi:outer membrane beta-barrel protein [Flavobacterium marginilacus]|nr:outer membrane beta-barrel protein [Flavobacterium marginilacus]
MGSLDLAVQKQLADNRLSVRIAVSDILYTGNWSGETQYGELFIRGNGGYESRQFKVNLSYNFGNKEIKETRKRASVSEEEKARITN